MWSSGNIQGLCSRGRRFESHFYFYFPSERSDVIERSEKSERSEVIERSETAERSDAMAATRWATPTLVPP